MSQQNKPSLIGHYGAAVTGKQFWPRPDLVEDLKQTLLLGESVALFGLRRIGKSSLMKEVEQQINNQYKTNQAYVVIYVDAQDFGALDKILIDILQKLPSEGKFDALKKAIYTNKFIPTTLQQILEKALHKQTPITNDAQEQIFTYWKVICEEISKSIKDSDIKLILMIDEFPFMCKNLLAKDNGNTFVNLLLATFRQWRTENITMVLSGSIGMQSIVRQHNLEFIHLNDCTPMDIPPLESREDAKKMINALVNYSNVEQWHDETTETLLDEVGAYYPSFIQFAFSRMKTAQVFTRDDICDFFAEHIRPKWDVTFFDQFNTRMRVYDPQLKKVAARVFNHLLHADKGIIEEAQLNLAEDMLLAPKLLAEDGFLRLKMYQKDGSYIKNWQFSSSFVKQWWQIYQRNYKG